MTSSSSNSAKCRVHMAAPTMHVEQPCMSTAGGQEASQAAGDSPTQSQTTALGTGSPHRCGSRAGAGSRAPAPHSLLAWLQILTQQKNLHPTPLLQEVPRGTRNQSLCTVLLLSSKCSQKMSNTFPPPPSLPPSKGEEEN